MKKKDIIARLERAEAERAHLADRIGVMNKHAEEERTARVAALEDGIGDLIMNPGRKVIVITPNGHLVTGLILSINTECDGLDVGGSMVGGLQSSELRIGLQP